MRAGIPLLIGLLVGCGGGDESSSPPADVPEETPLVAQAPPPAYPDDEAITGLLPAEPAAAQEAIEAAAAARKRADEARKKAEAEAARAAEATPDPATLGPMEVLSAVLAEKIVDRRPVGESATFREGSEVTCFNHLGNPGGIRRTVRHVWLHEGKRKSSIKLSVKGKKWRTWSSLPVYGPGSWRVDIVDEAGHVLKSLPFTVSP